MICVQTDLVGFDRLQSVRSTGLIVLWLAGACGHVGFDERPSADAAIADAPPPTLIACGTTPRFTIAMTSSMHLAAAATTDGYRVFTTDAAGQVRGSAFTFSTANAATTLGSGALDVAIVAGASGPLGVLTSGDQSLLAAPYGGPPSALGTSLVPLDAQLAPLGPTVRRDGWYGAAGALAQRPGGAIAFLIQQIGPAQPVEAQVVSPLGGDAGGASRVVDSSEGPNTPTILAAGAGYVATWNATAPSPDPIRAVLLNDQLQPTALTSTQISPTDAMADSFAARVAYLPGASRYLFVWTEKVSGDQIWMSLRDASLAPVGAAVMVTADGVAPNVVASRDDFLVAWTIGNAGLGAARVSRDGQLTQRPAIQTSGGGAAAWDLVSRNDQPVLVWLEAGGTGPNLWFDPLCTP